MDYSYIIIPIIVAITSQVLKLLTDGIKGNFSLKNLLQTYGGFPSSHTAFTVSITTLVGLRIGFDAPIFAIALVFTLLIMRDALGFRNLLGKQAKTFNQLLNQLPKEEKKSALGGNIPNFEERIGHSPIEVLGGVFWGIVLTYFLNLL
jgi:acid phosphatase family membrane protein YuiD